MLSALLVSDMCALHLVASTQVESRRCIRTECSHMWEEYLRHMSPPLHKALLGRKALPFRVKSQNACSV